MLRSRLAALVVQQRSRDALHVLNLLADPRHLHERGGDVVPCRRISSSRLSRAGVQPESSSSDSSQIAGPSSHRPRSLQALSEHQKNPDILTRPDSEEAIVEGVEWPREERYRFQNEAPSLLPSPAYGVQSNVKGKLTAGVDTALAETQPAMEGRMEAEWARRAEQRKMDLRELSGLLHIYRSQVNSGPHRLRANKHRDSAHVIMAAARALRASRFFKDEDLASLFSLRKELSELALNVLDNTEPGEAGGSGPLNRFHLQCLRVEIIAYTQGTDAACEAVSDLALLIPQTLCNGSRRLTRKEARVLSCFHGAVQSIFESSYERGSNPDALNRVAERMLDCKEFLRSLTWSTVRYRSRLYFYLRKIRSPLALVEEKAKEVQGTHLDEFTPLVSVLILAMARAYRTSDAYGLLVWAGQNNTPIKMAVVQRLFSACTSLDDDDLAGDVLRIMRKQADRGGEHLQNRTFYRAIASRTAKLGLVEDTQEALRLMKRATTKQLEATDERFAIRIKLILASVTGASEEVIVQLRRQCDVDSLFEDTETPAEGKSAMRKPNAEECRMLIEALLRDDQLHQAESVMRNAVAQEIELTPASFDALLTFYVRRNDVSSALNLFRELVDSRRRLSAVTVNQMIRLFGRNLDIGSANQMLAFAGRTGIAHTRQLYTSLLQAHVEAQSWAGALRLFQHMCDHPKRSLRPGISDYNVMLRLYVHRPMPVRHTYAFLSHMLRIGLTPSPQTFTAILLAAADGGLPDILESIFTLADRRLGGTNGRPADKGANSYHFTVMIQYYLSHGDFDRAQMYLQELLHRKEPVSGLLRSIIVDAYARTQDVDASVDVAEQLAQTYVAESPQDFVQIYLPLIRRAAQDGDADVIEKLIREAATRGLEVPVRIWNELLDALRREGNAEGAMQVWDLIFNKVVAQETVLQFNDDADGREAGAVVVPKSRRHLLCIPLSTIIDALTHAGRHDEIARIWIRCREHGFGFDSHNWNHLTVALVQAGRIADACGIIENVLDADPPHRRDRALLQPDVWLSRARLRAEAAKAAQKDCGAATEPVPPAFMGQAEYLFGESAGDRTYERGSRHQRGSLEAQAGSDEATMPSEFADDHVNPTLTQVESEEALLEALEPLEARQLMETVMSPWYAHFETMRMLFEIVQDATRSNDGHIALRPLQPISRQDGTVAMHEREEGTKEGAQAPQITTVQALMRDHPRVQELLRVFERRLEWIREREREGDERDTLLAQTFSQG